MRDIKDGVVETAALIRLCVVSYPHIGVLNGTVRIAYEGCASGAGPFGVKINIARTVIQQTDSFCRCYSRRMLTDSTAPVIGLRKL